MLEYIDNFKERYGTFNYAKENESFYPSLTEKYLADTMNATISSLPESEKGDPIIEMPEQSVSVELEQDANQNLEASAVSEAASNHDERIDEIKPKRTRLTNVSVDLAKSTGDGSIAHRTMARHRSAVCGGEMNRASISVRNNNHSDASESHTHPDQQAAQFRRNDGSTRNIGKEPSACDLSDATDHDSSDDCRFVGFTKERTAFSRSRGVNEWRQSISTRTSQYPVDADTSTAVSRDSCMSSSTFEYLQSTMEAKMKTLIDCHSNQLMETMNELLAMTHASFNAQLNSEQRRLQHEKQRLAEQNIRLIEKHQQKLDIWKTYDWCSTCLEGIRKRTPIFCDAECEENYRKKRRC